MELKRCWQRGWQQGWQQGWQEGWQRGWQQGKMALAAIQQRWPKASLASRNYNAQEGEEEHSSSTVLPACTAYHGAANEWSGHPGGKRTARCTKQMKDVAHCTLPILDTTLHPGRYFQGASKECQQCGTPDDGKILCFETGAKKRTMYIA